MTENVTVAAQERPQIRRIGIGDLRRALRLGWRDYLTKPSHYAVLGVIYPLLGLFLLWWVYGKALLPLVFPLVSGFALIGPFAALLFYELSRRIERGEDIRWQATFRVFRSASIRPVAAMGLILAGLFIVWIWTADNIYQAIMPAAPDSVKEFVSLVFGTPEGTRLILVGCSVGVVFAVIALTISVVSFPLLLDRRENAATAIGTSVRAVLANPVPMAIWGLIVVALLVLGAIPLLTGLSVVVPVLGHATWHLYRAVVI